MRQRAKRTHKVSSVQGGTELELHEVRWKVGADRPPWVDAADVIKRLCALPSRSREARRMELRTMPVGTAGAAGRPGWQYAAEAAHAWVEKAASWTQWETGVRTAGGVGEMCRVGHWGGEQKE